MDNLNNQQEEEGLNSANHHIQKRMATMKGVISDGKCPARGALNRWFLKEIAKDKDMKDKHGQMGRGKAERSEGGGGARAGSPRV